MFLAARLVAVEDLRAGEGVAGRVRVARIGAALRQVLRGVAVIAERGPVAALARRGVPLRFEGMAGDPVIAVDEVAIHALAVLDLGADAGGLRVAVGAEGLLVAQRARRRRGARLAAVLAREVGVVAEIGDGLQRVAGELDVAGVAAALIVLLPVIVAFEARLHRQAHVARARRLGELLVADLALLADLLHVIDVLLVIDDDQALALRIRRGLLHVGVALVALAVVLVLLVALQAFFFRRAEGLLHVLGVVDLLVAAQAGHALLGVLLVRNLDQIAGEQIAAHDRRAGDQQRDPGEAELKHALLHCRQGGHHRTSRIRSVWL